MTACTQQALARFLTADTVLTQAADVKQEEKATAPPLTHTLNVWRQRSAQQHTTMSTCTLLFASAAKAHVTSPLIVLLTNPEYLQEPVTRHKPQPTRRRTVQSAWHAAPHAG